MKATTRTFRTSIFIDTSAFFALADRTDRFHQSAVQFVEGNHRLLVTSNLVVFATLTLIRMRLGHDAALSFGRKLFEESVIPLIRVKPADEGGAWAMFRRYHNQRFSFVDCTSFAVMDRRRIPAAFAFDQDFRRLGRWVVHPPVE